MKKILGYILAIMTAIGFSACNNGSNHNNGNAKAQNGNLLSLETDSFRITWIKDNPGDKLMPRSLFPEAPDSLIAALGLQNGIPSTVSVFLLETDSLKFYSTPVWAETSAQCRQALTAWE